MTVTLDSPPRCPVRAPLPPKPKPNLPSIPSVCVPRYTRVPTQNGSSQRAAWPSPVTACPTQHHAATRLWPAPTQPASLRGALHAARCTLHAKDRGLVRARLPCQLPASLPLQTGRPPTLLTIWPRLRGGRKAINPPKTGASGELPVLREMAIRLPLASLASVCPTAYSLGLDHWSLDSPLRSIQDRLRLTGAPEGVASHLRNRWREHRGAACPPIAVPS